MKIIEYNNVTFKLGESAKENWEMLDTENPDHYFFHLSSFPSGYCSMQSSEASKELINFGATICKNGTKYRNMKNIGVDICKFSNLIKGEKVGEVFFISNRQVKKIKI